MPVYSIELLIIYDGKFQAIHIQYINYKRLKVYTIFTKNEWIQNFVYFVQYMERVFNIKVNPINL